MEADNGAVSVEKLMRRDFNLFLTDLNMPELDGAGIIRAVRQVLKELTRSSSSRPKVKSKIGGEGWFGVRMDISRSHSISASSEKRS